MKDPHGLPKGVLKGLQAEHPVVKRAAVSEVFRWLGQHSQYQSAGGAGLLQQCISSQDRAVAEEAVQQLISFLPKPGLSTSDGTQILLAALATSGEAGASTLVSGVVELLYKGAGEGTLLPKLPSGHPLFKILSAHPSAPVQLLACFEGLLTQPKDTAKLRRQWLQWQPFICLALLDHGEGAARLPFAMGLHAIMVSCMETSCCNTELKESLTDLLVSVLPYLPLKLPEQRAWAAAYCVVTLRLCNSQNQRELSARTAGRVLHMCFELTQHGDSILGILPGLAAALQQDVGLLHACLPSLALLAQLSPQHAADAVMDHMLSLCRGLDSLPPSLRGLLEVPLLTSVAFAWPSYAQRAKPLLDWLTALTTTSNTSAFVKASQDLLGQPAVMAVAAATLDRFFQPDTGASEALHWLRSIRWDFGFASSRGTHLSEASRFMLCALLEHSTASVKVAAAETIAAAAKAVPVCGISFLPVLVHHLQRMAADTPASGVQQHAEVELALMRAIPAMGRDAASLPYVTRVLEQLCPPGAPDRLVAVSIRLHCKLWREAGHNFNKLRELLTPDRSQLRMPEIVALSTAAIIKEVCLHDVDRGMQLLEGIQFFLPNTSPGPAALALEALGVLCERGGISFPDAWKLLLAARLQRTDAELPRAAWTALLGHAHATAEKHPEQAAAHQQTLWEAAKDPSARVRAAAYGALASWSFEVLELLELERPLNAYSSLLLEETDGTACAACEALVIRALAHEHARRRRHIGARPKAGRLPAGRGEAGEEGPTLRRLTRLIPKHLLSSAPDNLGVTLLLWAPAKPTAKAVKNRVELAASAAKEYAAKFKEILGQAVEIDPEVDPPLALHSWRCFLARWMGALSASADQDLPEQGQAARQQACAQLWDAVLSALKQSYAEACLAAQAAGALHGLAAESCPSLAKTIETTLEDVAFKCRSRIVSQALLDSLRLIDWFPPQQSSSAIEAFLGDLHHAVAFVQSTKGKAAECVAKLEELPGMLQSSSLGYSASEAEVLRLMRLVSGTSLPGRCVGAAATALGCVVNALPSRPKAETGPSAAMLDQVLSALRAATENAPRLSQSTSARVGIAQGLAALLGGPYMVQDAPGGGTWLLTRVEYAGHAKQALEMLEALTQQDTEIFYVRDVAAWCLAAAAAAARASSRGLQVSDTGSKQQVSSDRAALAALPEDSAMRALIEHLVAPSANAGLNEADSIHAANRTAAILRCLAAAERLAPVDWGQQCGTLIRSQYPGTDCLALAAIELLIAHPDAMGCGTLLSQLLEEQEFKKLPFTARQQLLEGCGSVLASLGQAQQDQIIRSLPALSSGDPLLAASSWRGLGMWLRHKSEAQTPVEVAHSTYSTVGQMLEALPVPAQSSPGIEAWLQAEHLTAAEQQHAAVQERQAAAPACSDSMEPEWQLWRAALHALTAMPEIAAALLRQERPWTIQRAFAVTIMVAWQRLPAQHLAECRAWCLSTPAIETFGVPSTVARACALSCNAQSSASQGQLLLQLLDPRQVFPEQGEAIFPGASMGLAALYVAALATSEHRDPVQAHISMHPGSTACEAMPSMLASVLKQKEWQGTSLTKNSAEVMYSVLRHRDCEEQLHGLMCRCLLAARADMDSANIQQLSMVIGRRHEA